MQINIHDPMSLISNWILEDMETAKLVSETPEWRDKGEHGTMTAVVTVNGIELPVAAFERYLTFIYELTVRNAEEKYADLDAEAERRAEEIINKKGKEVLDLFDDLRDNLDRAGQIVTSTWERENGI